MKILCAALTAVLLLALSACARAEELPDDTADAVSGSTVSQKDIARPPAMQGDGDDTAVDSDPGSEATGLYSRTTARSFSEEPVTESQIRQLSRAAFASPTGGNQRAREFVMITDRAVMAEIQQGHPYAQALDTAPLVIVVAANKANATYPELLEFDSGKIHFDRYQ